MKQSIKYILAIVLVAAAVIYSLNQSFEIDPTQVEVENEFQKRRAERGC